MKPKQILDKIIMEQIKKALNEESYPEEMQDYDKKTYDSMEDPEEKRLWWSYIKQARKHMSMNKFKPGTSPMTKSFINKAYSDLEKYRRNKEKKSLNMDAAKKIFKSHGLSVTTYRSTAIRGYSIPSSNSYEISKHDPSNIEFNGISTSTFDSIVSDLEEAGFKIGDKRTPSKVTGQSNHGSIQLKK